MLHPSKIKIIQDFVAGSSREELIWLNGYVSGMLATGKESAESIQPTKPLAGRMTITYGTETGNSKKLASEFAARAKKAGINTKLVSLDQYRLTDLAREEYFLTVISTQGDGEPPAAAKKFYDHIHQNGCRLNKLKFAVLALGDTAYPLFCKAGEDVDIQLQKIGGERLATLRRCDTDYEPEANDWFSEILQKINSGFAEPSLPISTVPQKVNGKKYFRGRLLSNVNLIDIGSDKWTHHIEIESPQIVYEPGDSLGLVPENPKPLVDSILTLTKTDPDKILTLRSESNSIQTLLTKRLNIVHLPARVVSKYADLLQQEIPETKISLLDLLKIYPVNDAAQFEEVIGILEPLAPRLYSISSSPQAHPDEIHLTVTKDSFRVNGELKYGLCSTFLTSLEPGSAIEFYIHPNSRFKLPAPEKDIIMIGPGTGIAPFRSFIAERDSTGASGRNWLFFGNQHFNSDFLYQTELQNWLQSGALSKLNVAFSRDQQNKIYVQHKMLDQSAELFSWLEQGAYIYICGSKDPMSTDVEKTLLQIISKEAGKSKQQAEAYLHRLREEGRLSMDVY